MEQLGKMFYLLNDVFEMDQTLDSNKSQFFVTESLNEDEG